MKFSDIPQFTKSGSYEVCFPLQYFVRWLDENQRECGLQLDSDFQRGHVWTEQQQIAYVEFLLRGGTSGRVMYFNCPSWLGSGIKDGYDDFVCVDGLQRITAILRFMNNEIPAFGTLYKDFEGRMSRDVNIFVNVNNLKTRKEVLQWYIEMNEGGTPHSSEEIDRVKALLEKEV